MPALYFVSKWTSVAGFILKEQKCLPMKLKITGNDRLSDWCTIKGKQEVMVNKVNNSEAAIKAEAGVGGS